MVNHSAYCEHSTQVLKGPTDQMTFQHNFGVIRYLLLRTSIGAGYNSILSSKINSYGHLLSSAARAESRGLKIVELVFSRFLD